jgi:hypothetical protein
VKLIDYQIDIVGYHYYIKKSSFINKKKQTFYFFNSIINKTPPPISYIIENDEPKPLNKPLKVFGKLATLLPRFAALLP